MIIVVIVGVDFERFLERTHKKNIKTFFTVFLKDVSERTFEEIIGCF